MVRIQSGSLSGVKGLRFFNMLFTVYILYSEAFDISYTGFTSGSLQKRLRKDLADHSGFTARAKDWKLVHSEIFESKNEAMKREKEIKKWKSKKKIEELFIKNR